VVGVGMLTEISYKLIVFCCSQVTLGLTLAQAGTDAPEWHADDADSADKR